MPTRSTTTTTVADTEDTPPVTNADLLLRRMDTIVMHLQRMDKRDKLRTWGAFVRGLLGLIPLILLIWSTWYVFAHGDELLKKITEESAKQAMQYSGQQSSEFMKQFQEMIQPKQEQQ